jgi:aspartyl-tRNA(Asn)/glutamyl-tRNA(Gln) amidotransferase subunit A
MADVFSKVEAATLHGQWMRERRDLYSQAVFSRTEPGLHVPAVRYLEALQMRAKILHEFLHGTMQDLDVLICPTMPIPVPTHREADVETPGKVFGVVTALTPLVRPFNYLGLPSLTMPIGIDCAGMPIGAQLVGRPFAEARLLSVAHQLSKDIAWDRLANMKKAQARKVEKR